MAYFRFFKRGKKLWKSIFHIFSKISVSEIVLLNFYYNYLHMPCYKNIYLQQSSKIILLKMLLLYYLLPILAQFPLIWLIFCGRRSKKMWFFKLHFSNLHSFTTPVFTFKMHFISSADIHFQMGIFSLYLLISLRQEKDFQRQWTHATWVN